MPLDFAPEVFIPAAALGELFRRRTLLGSANCLPVGFQKGEFPEGRLGGGCGLRAPTSAERRQTSQVDCFRFGDRSLTIHESNPAKW
jgi:hypothetical protein